MNIGNLTDSELFDRLRGPGLCLHNGPFLARLLSPLPNVASGLRTLYADHPLVESADFCDMTLRAELANWPRKARLVVDGEIWTRTYAPLALACVEWGLNWSLFRRAHHLLVIHAANLERDGQALILPADPGSGKSTLCAALAHSGWRLMSDELALVDLKSGTLTGLARPICLKDASIPAIARFAPSARFGPALNFLTRNSRQPRTIQHVCPPTAAVAARHQPALPRLVIFPQFVRDAPTALDPVDPPDAFLRVAKSCFNYRFLGEQGFRGLGELIEQSDCYQLEYGDLADAVAQIGALLEARRPVGAAR